MPDKKQSNRIICEGGLDSTQNYLNLSANKPGCATRLVNYEVGLSGGYRRLNGYAPYDPIFQEVGVGVAQGRVLGVMIFDNSDTGVTEIIAARRDLAATTYSFYKYNDGVGWQAISTGLTHNYIVGGAEVEKLRYSVGNDGSKNYLAIVDGVNNAVLFDGTDWVFIDPTNTGPMNMTNAGGDQAIAAPHLVQFFESSLFLSCDTINNFDGLTCYSAPNAFVDFTSASGGGQIPTGHQIVDAKPFRDIFYFFGANSIKKVVADPTAGFLAKDVTLNIGCVARDSVIEVGGDLIFLGPDGFRPISGTDKIGDVYLEGISKPIHNLIKNRITALSGTVINSVVIRGKSQFRYFFGDDGYSPAESKGIIAALRTPDQATGWEFGELLGFRVSCITSRYVDGEELVLAGDYDGVVYRHEYGDTLNGDAMISIYSTPYLDLGDTEVRKVAEKITTFLNGEGSIDLNIAVSYDWGRSGITNPQNYDIEIEAIIPTYDGGETYDSGIVYGGILTPVEVSNIEGSFFSIRITYSSVSSDPPHSIHAIVMEYALAGRR